MKAIVLAAGLGTRLGALTAQTPKCLIPVGPRTMLEHTIERLQRAGVSEAVINTHYLAEQIERFVEEKGQFGMRVELSHEPKILGTGGGIKNAAWFFDQKHPFFVYNSDVYCDVDLSLVMAAHLKANAIATVVVSERSESSYLLFDSEGKLVGWRREVGTADLARACDAPVPLGFCGIQLLNGAIFKYMEQQSGPFSIIETYMLAVRAGETIMAFRADGNFWVDMGTPEKLQSLRKYLEG